VTEPLHEPVPVQLSVQESPAHTTSLHDPVPMHDSVQRVARLQSRLLHAASPQLTSHGIPAGHTTAGQKVRVQSITHVEPAQVPPAAAHVSSHACIATAGSVVDSVVSGSNPMRPHAPTKPRRKSQRMPPR